MRSSATGRLEPAFNKFLFAQVCEDRSEEPLSVVSALARLNLDPWAEAAALAVMPAGAAAQRLTLLLAKLPGRSPPARLSAAAAMGLIALLPRRGPAARARPLGAVNGDLRRLRVARLLSVIFVAVATFDVVFGHPPAQTLTPVATASRDSTTFTGPAPRPASAVVP